MPSQPRCLRRRRLGSDRPADKRSHGVLRGTPVAETGYVMTETAARNNGHHPDDPGPTEPSEPDEQPGNAVSRFFDHNGLRVLDLADEVTRTVTCGFGGIDERF